MPGIESHDPDEEEGEVSLLNGPQMPDKAVTQDDIDKILSEFD